jgi:hypothetical protein
VKISESAIKIVINDKRKWLIRLNQKVREFGRVFSLYALVVILPPVKSRHLTQYTFKAERGNPVLLPDEWDSSSQGEPMAVRDWDFGKSECRVVMTRIRV